MDKSRLHPWSRQLLSTALFCYLCLAAVSVHTQSRFEGEGRVVAVDETQGMVTLDHGPIPGLMPAMRMAFPVQQVEWLQGLQVGAVVRFSLQARGPEWVIATIEPVGEPPSPRPTSFPAPDFTLPTLSGAPIRLSELRGKVVLLNFWATWCVPCRTEMPTLEALYHRYKDRGLEVLAVNVDMLSTAGVETFVKEVTVTFQIVLDPSWSVAQAYRVLGLPTTYLIDRVGNVVVREVGERNWMDNVSQMAVAGLLQ
jgi:thiol-disulfide isomerase/thioredoxin/Cu/Ag efflux protein CusF